MSTILSDPQEQPQGARARVAASVIASGGACEVCGVPLTGKQEKCCSGRCRAALSRRTRAEGQAERDRRVRELLETALRVAGG